MTGGTADDGTPTATAVLPVGWLCLAWTFVLVPGLRTSVLRPVTVYPIVFLLPGYALLCAVEQVDPARLRTPELSGLERFVFAVGLSLAVSMLVGIALLLTVGVTGPSALAVLSVVVLLGPASRSTWSQGVTGSGWPSATHFRDRLAGIGRLPREMMGGETLPSATVGVLVIAAGLVGVAGVGYLTVGHEAPGYTEFSTIPANDTATGSSGTVTFRPGDEVTLQLTNREGETARYTVVPIVQRAAIGSSSVTIARTGPRMTIELGPGERWTEQHRPTVSATESEVRVVYRVYRGETVSGSPEATTHLWVDRPSTDATNVTTAESVGIRNDARDRRPSSQNGAQAP
ncbi:DUF1616 domain-containing protein [Halosimplex amylolyticum]|uniref:DUF1616 domain-containing protein n=1 Tax=Halosimplex amylolyticum TaxID=3396616 RepID=UPI003F56B5AB